MNKIDGRCLIKCNTVEDVKEFGILFSAKASILFEEVMKLKNVGVTESTIQCNLSSEVDSKSTLL